MSHSNQHAVPSILFFLQLLSLLRKSSAGAKYGWIKSLFSFFIPFPSVPRRGRERSDYGKGVGDKSHSESPSRVCCRKVRRAVGCFISYQNCFSSRAVRSELRSLPTLPSTFFFLSYQCKYLFTLFYARVKKLRCQKGVFPHTQAWESPESKCSLTDI